MPEIFFSCISELIWSFMPRHLYYLHLCRVFYLYIGNILFLIWCVPLKLHVLLLNSFSFSITCFLFLIWWKCLQDFLRLLLFHLAAKHQLVLLGRLKIRDWIIKWENIKKITLQSKEKQLKKMVQWRERNFKFWSQF
jgi:hypothetical protein